MKSLVAHCFSAILPNGAVPQHSKGTAFPSALNEGITAVSSYWIISRAHEIVKAKAWLQQSQVGPLPQTSKASGFSPKEISLPVKLGARLQLPIPTCIFRFSPRDRQWCVSTRQRCFTLQELFIWQLLSKSIRMFPRSEDAAAVCNTNPAASLATASNSA